VGNSDGRSFFEAARKRRSLRPSISQFNVYKYVYSFLMLMVENWC
jgi:hypothetical protein